MTESAFRIALRTAAARLGFDDTISPHSLRRGGATHDIMRKVAAADVALRGRWASEKSINTYVRRADAALAELKQSAGAAALGRAVAAAPVSALRAALACAPHAAVASSLGALDRAAERAAAALPAARAPPVPATRSKPRSTRGGR
jgi:hypothetical protein